MPDTASTAGVPPTDPLAAYAGHAGHRLAVVDSDQEVTYAEFNSLVNRLVHGLSALGLGVGETAAWCGPNSTEVLAFMHACRKLGVVALPVPYRFTAGEMRHLLEDSGATCLAVDPEQEAVVAEIASRLPALRHVVVFGPGSGENRAFQSWSAVVAGSSDEEPPAPSGYGAAIMYTSGTTGKPKGAVRTRSDRTLLATMLRELRFGAEEVHLLTGPLYHAGPNAFALLTHFSGGTVVVMRRFDAAEWVRLVTAYRVTSTFATPTHVKRIVALPDEVLQSANLGSLRSLIVSAAPFPFTLKQEVIAKLGEGFLFEVYGSTELGIDTILKPEDQLRKPGSCGKPYGGIEVMIASDDGRRLAPGEVGEMFVRTPLAVDGYHGSAGQLTELPPPEGDSDQGHWKSVGDIGFVDDEGYVYVCDRRTDMIISGGSNVYPAEVESVLHSHPDVLDVAVFGVPDDEWGERVHAVIQPRPGRRVDVGDLDAYAAGRLAGFKRPRSWDVRAELPRTESGKLLKRVLREEHWSGRPQPV